MLQSIRGFGGGIVLKLFLGLIVLSFVFWGIGDFMHTGGRDEAARVGDIAISNQQMEKEIQKQTANIRNMFGGQLPPNFMQAMNVEGVVLRQLVQEALLKQEVKKLGLKVDDKIVTQIIAQNPAFRNADGQFDRERFRQILWNMGESEQSYIENLKESLGIMFLVQTITAAPALPDAKFEAVNALNSQKRIAEYAIVKPSAIQLEKPAAEVLKSYYESHPKPFSTLEKRDVSYITFGKKDVSTKREVTEEQLKAEYDSRIQEFTKGETREVQQMLFDDQAKADKASELIKAGKPFMEVAKQNGFTSKQVNVGTIEKKELFDEVADSVFRLPVNGSSDVVQSEAGFHIFHVSKVNAAQVTPFSDVKANLKSEMQTVSSSEALYALANKVEDELAGGAKLEELAKTMDLKVSSVKELTVNSTQVKNLPDGAEFIHQAFEAEEGNESSLILAKDQENYYVLRVDALTPVKLLPFESVQKDVAAAWQKDESAKRLKALANELAERQEKGEALTKIAAEKKLEVRKSAPLTREAQGNLPGDFVQQLFQTEKDAVQGAYQSMDGSYVFGRLAGVVSAPALDEKGKAALRQQLEEGFLDDLLAQYTAYLEDRYPVTVREKPKSTAAQ